MWPNCVLWKNDHGLIQFKNNEHYPASSSGLYKFLMFSLCSSKKTRLNGYTSFIRMGTTH